MTTSGNTGSLILLFKKTVQQAVDLLAQWTLQFSTLAG